MRDAIADDPMRDRRTAPKAERLAKIERLRRLQQLDRDDVLQIDEHLRALPRRDGAHADVILLTGGGRDGIHRRGE